MRATRPSTQAPEPSRRFAELGADTGHQRLQRIPVSHVSGNGQRPRATLARFLGEGLDRTDAVRGEYDVSAVFFAFLDLRCEPDPKSNSIWLCWPGPHHTPRPARCQLSSSPGEDAESLRALVRGFLEKQTNEQDVRRLMAARSEWFSR